MENNNKIRSFQDLIAWQESHSLALKVYSITSKFPRQEPFSLVDQMRRCAISISSNIAEGFSRNSQKEKRQFYYMSLGSVTELQNQLILSKDLNYISNEVFSGIYEQTVRVHKLTNGLIKSSKSYT